MKTVLFCSILIAFFTFSCKPKPLDNLKEVALKVEENKVRRVSRGQLAQETQRVADSVLTLVLSERRQAFMGKQTADSLCNFSDFMAYRQFQEKYHGRASVVSAAADIQKLNVEIAELRRYNNQLPEKEDGFPATFQTLTDSLLYVRQIVPGQQLCQETPASGFWVFRIPKQKLIEIKTVKVKPKPAKGPNW